MKKIIFLLLLSAISLSSLANEVVSVASLEWPPYASKESEKLNASNRLVEKIFEQVGIEAQISFYPWSRSLMLASQGKVDCLGPEYYSDNRNKDFIYSDAFDVSPLILVARADFEKDSYTDINFLTRYKVGVVRNYINTPSIDDNKNVIKDEALDDINNIEKLQARRVELIVIDEKVFDYIIETRPFRAKFKKIYPVLEKKKLHLVFSKAKKNSVYLRDKFNEGRKILKGKAKQSPSLVVGMPSL